MKWSIIKKQGALSVNGFSYDLSHLKDANYFFTVPATKGYPEAAFEVLVQYSSHCVSWGPPKNGKIDFSSKANNRRIFDDKKIHRCFCDDRYYWSKELPSIFKTLIERKCYFTGHSNWLVIERLDSLGNNIEYEVFFNLSREGKKMLRIYVESAYVRYPKMRKQYKRDNTIKARVLLTKKLRREAIKSPPNRGRR